MALTANRLRSLIKDCDTNFFRPCSPYGLAVFRIVFGALMVVDLFYTRGFATIDEDWGKWSCNFPLFESLPKPSPAWITILYFLSALGGTGIALGCQFKTSCWLFTATYAYIHLLDKSQWNNHFYLYALLGGMLASTNANAVWSLDATPEDERPFRMGSEGIPVERWQYLMLQWQAVLVYLIAGLKKICDPDWVNGYSARRMDLPYPFHWIVRNALNLPGDATAGPLNLVVVHWAGMIFDTIVGPAFLMRSTRNTALLMSSIFHATNFFSFRIGVFPLVMASMSSLFYDAGWPTKTTLKLGNEKRSDGANEQQRKLPAPSGTTRKMKIYAAVGVFFSLQLFLPYSHWITRGYNGWTQGLYGYSWDMMVHNWYTGQVKLKFVDKMSDEVYIVNPTGLARSIRWSQHPDMILQMGQCLTHLYCEQRRKMSYAECRDRAEVYPTDIWKSLNFRPIQRMFRPGVDLNHQGRRLWHPLHPAEHLLLPIVSDQHRFPFTPPGSKEEDFIFGDFYGMGSEYAITQSVINVTLRVVDGSVQVETTSPHDRKQRYELSANDKPITLDAGYEVFVRVASRPFALFRMTLRTEAITGEAVDSAATAGSNFLSTYLRGMGLLARAIDDIVLDIPFEPSDSTFDEREFRKHFTLIQP